MAKSRAEARAETVERLLEAALDAFTERPVSEVSLADIAERAGFTKGAIYANFESKAQLLLAVLERRMTTQGADYVEIVRDLALDDIGEATGTRAHATTTGDLDYFRLVVAVWNEALDDPEIARSYAELRRAHRTRLAEMIERRAAEESLVLAVDAEHLAAGLIGMSMSAMLEALIDPDIDPGAIHRAMTSMVLAGVVASDTGEVAEG